MIPRQILLADILQHFIIQLHDLDALTGEWDG